MANMKDLIDLYNEHVIKNTKEITLNKATHDLLALNSDSSKDYRKAREEFENFYNDESNMVEMSTDAPDMLNTGFEYGFWAAAKILTGFKHEYDRD